MHDGLQTPRLTDRWDTLCEGNAKEALEALHRNALPTRRWFGGKARRIKSGTVSDVVPIPAAKTRAVVLVSNTRFLWLPHSVMRPASVVSADAAKPKDLLSAIAQWHRPSTDRSTASPGPHRKSVL